METEGSFAVTVPHEIDYNGLLPEGAVLDKVTYELFHIHEVDGAMVAESLGEPTVAEGTVSFNTDGFSEYVLKYTVEFGVYRRGQTENLKWLGAGSYQISDILDQIGVEGEIIDVSKRTNDVGGEADVLYLSEDKTELISERPFQDTPEPV